jgi:uncharacterized coiled-coil DUF342 family protein
MIVVLVLTFISARKLLPCRRPWLLIKKTSETAHQECIAEMEMANAELKTKLDQSHIKIAEMEAPQDSLNSGYRQLSDEYKELESLARGLQQEKAMLKNLAKLKLQGSR